MSRLWEYLDGELDAEEVLAMHRHLAECAGCRPCCECDRNFLALLARCAELRPGATVALRETVRFRLALIR